MHAIKRHKIPDPIACSLIPEPFAFHGGARSLLGKWKGKEEREKADPEAIA
jgi:hypothetical protein